MSWVRQERRGQARVAVGTPLVVVGSVSPRPHTGYMETGRWVRLFPGQKNNWRSTSGLTPELLLNSLGESYRTQRETWISEKQIIFCISVPNIAWNILMLEHYLLFTWNLHLTQHSVLVLLNLATLASKVVGGRPEKGRGSSQYWACWGEGENNSVKKKASPHRNDILF